MSQVVCILQNRLYWICDVNHPKNIPSGRFFNIDDDLIYQGFNKDFGPLDISQIYRYTQQVIKVLNTKQLSDKVFYHHTSTDYKKSTNSCLLICCFQMIYLGRSASEAFTKFSHIQFQSFRDASSGQCSYQCTILDCLRGLQYAMKLGWFNYKTFDVQQYQRYKIKSNGDLNWIIPNKFVAFSSPNSQKVANEVSVVQDYVPILKKFKVKAVVRLNGKTYDAQQFIQNGIQHLNLHFKDGTCPTLQIVNYFLNYCEKINGVIGVHCKAGLGRTGTLIACYAIKNYHFNAADFIGWIRLCRPGSILGPQQHFLIKIQKTLKDQSSNSPIWRQVKSHLKEIDLQTIMNNLSFKPIKMNETQKYVEIHGDSRQGQQLKDQKKSR